MSLGQCGYDSGSKWYVCGSSCACLWVNVHVSASVWVSRRVSVGMPLGHCVCLWVSVSMSLDQCGTSLGQCVCLGQCGYAVGSTWACLWVYWARFCTTSRDTRQSLRYVSGSRSATLCLKLAIRRSRMADLASSLLHAARLCRKQPSAQAALW